MESEMHGSSEQRSSRNPDVVTIDIAHLSCQQVKDMDLQARHIQFGLGMRTVQPLSCSLNPLCTSSA
jgi:hypothetical protein